MKIVTVTTPSGATRTKTISDLSGVSYKDGVYVIYNEKGVKILEGWYKKINIKNI